MGEEQTDWIDAAVARRLMLEYRQTLGVKGGSEIERQIDRHVRLGISRKTLENWLNDPHSVPSRQTLKIVQRFLNTKHFEDVVPRVHDCLQADARLRRIGTTLFDLYGVKGEDVPVSIEKNAYLAGWWTAGQFVNSKTTTPSYIQISPVQGHPFSRIHVLVRLDEVPAGSGLTFPTTAGEYLDFSVRVWSQGRRHREKILKLYCMPKDRNSTEDHLKLFFERAESTYSGLNTQSIKFNRLDGTAVPGAVRSLFEKWGQNMLPTLASQWGLIG